ncbi:unnamed protein product, partial [Ceratitis capitata]
KAIITTDDIQIWASSTIENKPITSILQQVLRQLSVIEANDIEFYMMAQKKTTESMAESIQR